MNSVIIAAGGTGTRMNSPLPKQFLVLAGKPMLMHTIWAFFRFDKTLKIIVVLPESLFPEWYELSARYLFKVPHILIPGGRTRFHSVRNGLDNLKEEEFVAVHDGARPLVSEDLIGRAFSEAEKHDTAIPVLPLSESLRLVEGLENHPVDRALYRIVQTPQVFRVSVLKQAYCREFNEQFTDDAAVVESMDYPIHLIDGEPGNIKITQPTDLVVAASLFKHAGPSI